MSTIKQFNLPVGQRMTGQVTETTGTLAVSGSVVEVLVDDQYSKEHIVEALNAVIDKISTHNWP